ncbi:MAG: GNAT family N-acetyltransferase, partial [Flavobacterium sp.]
MVNIILEGMNELKIIYKKDVPSLLKDAEFWNHSFLSISKHRLYAHYKNPNCNDDDVVLLLAYQNNELVGYMGIFIDKIVLDGTEDKIGWLSTWWVHPKTKGSGIGREILDKMYAINNGKIGISQFTPSAKRVYDKSNYFVSLKESNGIKAVLRSNFVFVFPKLFPWTEKLKKGINLLDAFLNIGIDFKLNIQKITLKKQLKNVSLEYLNIIDDEVSDIINKFNKNHISPKNDLFFEWLKAYFWVQEAPLLEMTNKSKYEFSIYDKSFNVYFLKVIENGRCIGFLVLQKRNNVVKLLFSYYDVKDVQIMANIIKLQTISQDVREIICYDVPICGSLKKSSVFLYKT